MSPSKHPHALSTICEIIDAYDPAEEFTVKEIKLKASRRGVNLDGIPGAQLFRYLNMAGAIAINKRRTHTERYWRKTTPLEREFVRLTREAERLADRVGAHIRKGEGPAEMLATLAEIRQHLKEVQGEAIKWTGGII